MLATMDQLDLREIRCPLALVLLKQQLLKLELNNTLEVIFINQGAMKDIASYLNKNNCIYKYKKDEHFNKLLIWLI